MDIPILDLFVRATTEVFSEIGFPDITISDESPEAFPAELLANIGIAGDLQGYFVLRSDLSSATKFITRMLENLEFEVDEQETFGRFHREAIGEVLNQVSGRSTMYLSEQEIDCDITPPTIILGSNVFMNMKSLSESICKAISGDFGRIGLMVGIKNARI
jgi:chemotaxis protein CheX